MLKVILFSLNFRRSSFGPLSGPFRKDLDMGPTRSNSFSPPSSANLQEKTKGGDVSPGPSSAPPDMQWSPSDTIVPSDSIMTNIDAQERSPLSAFPFGNDGTDDHAVSPADPSGFQSQEIPKPETSEKSTEELSIGSTHPGFSQAAETCMVSKPNVLATGSRT